MLDENSTQDSEEYQEVHSGEYLPANRRVSRGERVRQMLSVGKAVQFLNRLAEGDLLEHEQEWSDARLAERARTARWMVDKIAPTPKSIELSTRAGDESRSAVEAELQALGINPQELWKALPAR